MRFLYQMEREDPVAVILEDRCVSLTPEGLAALETRELLTVVRALAPGTRPYSTALKEVVRRMPQRERDVILGWGRIPPTEPAVEPDRFSKRLLDSLGQTPAPQAGISGGPAPMAEGDGWCTVCGVGIPTTASQCAACTERTELRPKRSRCAGPHDWGDCGGILGRFCIACGARR